MIQTILWQLLLKQIKKWIKSQLKEDRPMTREVIREEGDGLVEFIIGLVLGIATGGIVGLLFAPRSGAETKDSMRRFLVRLPSSVREDIQNPEGKTRSFIGKTLINLENQVGKVSKAIQAGKMAEAKKREEMASGYDYN